MMDDITAGAAKWEGRWQAVTAQPLPTRMQYMCECGYLTTHRVAFWKHEQTCGQASEHEPPYARTPT